MSPMKKLILATFAAISLTATSAWAASLSYIDEDGNTATRSSSEWFHLETSDDDEDFTLNDKPFTSWYGVLDANVTFNYRISVEGDVKLILADNCTVTFKKGLHIPAGNTLTIYGQSGGSGLLVANGDSESAGIGGGSREQCGTIVVHGGSIAATGGEKGAGIGCG